MACQTPRPHREKIQELTVYWSFSGKKLQALKTRTKTTQT